MRVRTGLEVLLRDPGEYLEGSIGLITNPTGVTPDLTSTIDTFHAHPGIEVMVIFGPEHGARGDVQDALPVESHTDGATGLPVHSLYGEFEKPTPEMLEGVETLVLDIQDVGARFYTYVSTLTYALGAASEGGIGFVVLDRPNPLNGVDVEGGVLKPGFESFIGLHPVPIRHGLTIGELALMINGEIGADLRVVGMEGWERSMWFDETQLPWVMPSPNLPTLKTATVYPGTCLFEGVNISEGRGTTRPFELIGAPWINGRDWAGEVNDIGLPGVRFRACHFNPTFAKHAGKLCNGVQIHVTDRRTLKPVETGLHMLASALRLWSEELRWTPPSHSEHPHFDLLVGTDKVREALIRGESAEEIVGSWRDDLDVFEGVRRESLIYGGEE
ncbi:MAG: DUF1343 domain-containing protein [Candidatus Bathyarchaeota archaeon]|jgi:beta-N-acetylhexosaminidase